MDRVTTPSRVLFIMLDATRADRLGSWGNRQSTSPWLDELGSHGVRFRRHFANSHATRASFPQLMTGRYFHHDVLRSFRPNDSPREFLFNRPDPSAVLLPHLLQCHGYETLGVSSHPWVVAESPLGRAFDRLDFISVAPSRGHADAPQVVDRALEILSGHTPSRPLFLYLHFMDMHMPRFLPEGEPRFPVEGFCWQQRFKPNGEPRFNRDLRRWSQFDARDFTALDHSHFVAAYDTRLSYTDEHIGRLLAALRDDDPGLRRTLVVVIADHGEELGEDGRTGHNPSLADGTQHIPWIIAGAGIEQAQEAWRFTENIDVAPTLLALLGLVLPPGTHMDGQHQLTPTGGLRPDHGKPAVYYVAEDYRAIRTRRYLLRQEIPDSFRARCYGPEQLYRLKGLRRLRLDASGHAALAARLRARLERRLDGPERAFVEGRYDRPATDFVLRPEFWRLPPEAAVTCVPLDGMTGRRKLRVRGWFWSGRGVTLLHPDGDHPLPLMVAVPDGQYHVELAVMPVEAAPRLFGYDRWLRKSFTKTATAVYLPLGTFEATAGRLGVAIPAEAGVGNHIIGLRLTPPAAAVADEVDDAILHERLKALGYVE